MGRGSLGRVLLLQVSSHLVPLLLQESSLHSLSFFVKVPGIPFHPRMYYNNNSAVTAKSLLEKSSASKFANSSIQRTVRLGFLSCTKSWGRASE